MEAEIKGETKGEQVGWAIDTSNYRPFTRYGEKMEKKKFWC